MRPTSDAVAIAILAALLLFVAVNVQAGWVYAVDGLLVAVLAVGWLSARLGSRGLMIRREMPTEIFEGDRVAVMLQVAPRRGRRYFIEVRDAIPGLSPHTAVIPACGARRPGVVTYHATAHRRGVHRAEAVDVRSHGLSGLFVSRRRIAVPGILTIFPRYWVLADFAVPGRTGADATSTPRPGRDGLEVAGVRDFRDGDSLRHVHWRSTARRGTLVVREFERDIHQPVALLLDTRSHAYAADRRDEAFEDMVRAAASVAHAVARSGREMYLIAASGTQIVRAAAGWSQALHWLARIQPDGARQPEDAYEEGVPVGTPAVVCSPDADAVAAMAQRGIPLAAVLADGSDEMLLRALGIPVAVLRRGEEVGACLASLRQ